MPVKSEPEEFRFFVANTNESKLYKPGHASEADAYRDAQRRFEGGTANLVVVEVVGRVAPVIMISRPDGTMLLMGPDGNAYEPQRMALPPPPEVEREPEA